MTYKDKTFCANKHCANKCGRKMTEKERAELKELPKELQLVSYSNFCHQTDSTIIHNNTEQGKVLH